MCRAWSSGNRSWRDKGSSATKDLSTFVQNRVINYKDKSLSTSPAYGPARSVIPRVHPFIHLSIPPPAFFRFT